MRFKKNYAKREKGPRTNEDIKCKEIRLIGKDGSQLGVVTPEEGLRLAKEAKLDLVEIAPTAEPPVCKIIDYGKYKYELTKKEKDAKKKQHVQQLKELKLKPNIDIHDLGIKMKHACEFLEEGNKVKVRMMFFGRQLAHVDIGEAVMQKVIDMLADYGKADNEIKKEGNNIILMFSPLKSNKKKSKE